MRHRAGQGLLVVLPCPQGRTTHSWLSVAATFLGPGHWFCLISKDHARVVAEVVAFLQCQAARLSRRPSFRHSTVLCRLLRALAACAKVSSGKLPRESFAHTCLCLASFPWRGFGLHCESLTSRHKFLLVISDPHACVLLFQQLGQGSASSQDAAHLASPLSKA